MNHAMERVAHLAHGFAQAHEWELKLYRELTSEQRQFVAKTLRERYYGKYCADIRDVVAGSRRRVRQA